MRHKYVNMDVNSAFLKLTNAMACVKIILNVKQKKFIDQDSSTQGIAYQKENI